MTERKSSKIYKVCSGLKINNEIENILFFEGSEKDCIEFLNKQYHKNEIICSFMNLSVFKINDYDWKTIQELKDENILEIKENKND